MSYIQIKNLGGKDRGLKFNQYALEVFHKHVDYEHVSNASAVYATFYAGLKGCSYVKQEEPDYTFEDVCNWVDELYASGRTEDIKAVDKVWTETHAYRNWLQEFQSAVRAVLNPEPEPAKKKVKRNLTGTKLKSSPLEV